MASLDMLRQLKKFTWYFTIYNPKQNFIQISSVANNIEEARDEMMRIIRISEVHKIRRDELIEEESRTYRRMEQIKKTMGFGMYTENTEYQQLFRRCEEIRRELEEMSRNLLFEGCGFAGGIFKHRLLILSSTMKVISNLPGRTRQGRTQEMTLEQLVLTEEPEIESFFSVSIKAERV